MAAARSEIVQEVRPDGRASRRCAAPWTMTVRVGDVAQEEHPHGAEQQGAGEHEEAGVAEGELEANAQPGALSTVSSFRLGVWLGVDAVSDAGDGGDDRGFAEAFAQCRDGDAHGVGERVCVLIPRPFQ